jgi:hypothetical protein
LDGKPGRIVVARICTRPSQPRHPSSQTRDARPATLRIMTSHTTVPAPGSPSVRQPLCAICGERTRGLTIAVRMTHGVSVWLCRTHASAEFQTRNAGRDLVDILACLWEAHGCLTAARRGALEAHLSRFAERPARPRPGSHAWAALRLRAEAEFALGVEPADTIRRLRAEVEGGPVVPPSVRTMRRWHQQGRWLRLALPPADGGDHVEPRVGPKRGVELRPLAIDVDVDVPAQRGPGLAQAVTQARPALVQPVDRLADGRRVDVEPLGQVGEDGGERDRKVDVGHQPITATSTEAMPGR